MRPSVFQTPKAAPVPWIGKRMCPLLIFFGGPGMARPKDIYCIRIFFQRRYYPEKALLGKIDVWGVFMANTTAKGLSYGQQTLPHW